MLLGLMRAIDDRLPWWSLGARSEPMEVGKDLYIDLMKRSLKNIPYLDVEANPIMPRGRVRKVVLGLFERFGVGLVHARRTDLESRLGGSDHTSVAHTMISMARLDNVQACVESVL